MSDETKPPDNFDRLLKHLKNGSLAMRLVQGYRASGAASPSESMKAVLRARLEQVRGDLDSTKT